MNESTYTTFIAKYDSPSERARHRRRVGRFHLFHYVDERMITFNERHRDDQSRFLAVIAMVSGRRLACAKLTGKG